MNYRSRYYDVIAGRFLQKDTYRERDLSRAASEYAYVSNSPAQFVDPEGQREWEVNYLSFVGQYPGLSPAAGVVIWWATPVPYWSSYYSDMAGIAIWYGAALGLWFFSGSMSSALANQPDSLAPEAGWDGAFTYASASLVPGYGVGVTMMLFNSGFKDAILATTNIYETRWPWNSGPGSAWTIGFDIGIALGVGYSVSYE